MVVRLTIIGQNIAGKAIDSLHRGLLKVAKTSNKTTKALRGLKNSKARQALRNIGNEAKRTATQMNSMLGGKPLSAQMNTLGGSLSSVSNRLGFMAFQWNFMANAAQRAVDMVLGGMIRIIKEGAKLSDALGRALAFATPIQDLRDMSEQGQKDLEGLRDAIFDLGSGKTIFGIDAISGQALELQKALDDLESTKVILPFAAALKTIEPEISDKKLGTGLVSIFQAFQTDTRDIEEVAKVLDFVANVANKSTANIKSVIASLGVSLQQAKQIGFEARDVGVIIGTISDVLARNEGGGRASATPGRFLNAFITDMRAAQDLSRKQGKAGAFFGLDFFDDQQQLKKLTGIVDEFRDLTKGKSEQQKANIFSQLGFGTNSIAVVNALLTKSTKELDDFNESLGERGTLLKLQEASMVNAQAQIDRINAAVGSMKLIFTNALTRPIRDLANIISEITADQEFRDFIGEIGKVIGEQVGPAIKFIALEFKKWFKLLSRNKKTLKLIIQAVLLLVGALAGLAILATVGFFALVAASSMAALTGQMLLAGGAMVVLRKGASTLLVRILPLIVIAAGLLFIGAALAGVFDDQLTPAIIALGIAITAIGAAPLIGLARMKIGIMALTSSMGALSLKITGVKAGFNAASGAFAAGSFGGAGAKGAIRNIGGIGGAIGGLGGAMTRMVSKLGKGNILIAAAAAGAIVITAFVLAMREEVKKSTVFKTGLVDEWQQVGFRMTAATNVFLRNIGGMFLDLMKGIQGMAADISSFISAVMAAAWNAFIALISGKGFDKAREIFEKGMQDAFGEFDLGLTFTAVFDPTGVSGFLVEIKKQLALFKEEGFTRIDDVVTNSIAEALKAFEIDPKNFSSMDIDALLTDVFGAVDLDNLSSTISEAQMKYDEMNGIVRKLAEKTEEVVANTGEYIESISGATGGMQIWDDTLTAAENSQKQWKAAQDRLTKKLDAQKEIFNGVNTSIDKTATGFDDISKRTSGSVTSLEDQVAALDINTIITQSDTNTIIRAIDFLDLNIIEVARNTNIMGQFSVIVEMAKLAFLKLALEGTEAARRISTLRVSKKGKFSMSGRVTNTSFGEREQLGNDIAAQTGVIAQALRDAAEKFIDLEQLAKTLADITFAAAAIAKDTGTAKIDTDTALASSVSGGSSFLAGIEDIKEFIRSINPGSKNPKFSLDESGNLNIDVNVDGVFDVTITQDLSAEEVAELVEEKLGEELSEGVLKALKVTS